MANEIWVSVGVTKNLGDFNSLRVDAGAKKEVENPTENDAEWDKLWSEVEDQVNKKLKEAAGDEE